jgi:hypothetical protein
MNTKTPSPDSRKRAGKPVAQPAATPAGATPGTPASHEPAPIDLGVESVAGEEDPGAALDTSVDPVSTPEPAGKPPRPAG